MLSYRVKNELVIKKLKERKVEEYPIFGGLYLVGNTAFNPYTDEKYYFLKVGLSSELNIRLKKYCTENPILWKADFYEVNDKDMRDNLETQCQLKLIEKCIQIMPNTTEWFEVDRETYLEVCEKGFGYFDMETYKTNYIIGLKNN